MVSVDDAVAPAAAAEISTVCEELTMSVETVNGAELWPPGTATVAGTDANTELLECRVTTTPPGGAGSASVMVPATGLPPVTPAAANWMVSAGLTVNVADAV